MVEGILPLDGLSMRMHPVWLMLQVCRVNNAMPTVVVHRHSKWGRHSLSVVEWLFVSHSVNPDAVLSSTSKGNVSDYDYNHGSLTREIRHFVLLPCLRPACASSSDKVVGEVYCRRPLILKGAPVVTSWAVVSQWNCHVYTSASDIFCIQTCKSEQRKPSILC